MKLLFIVYNAGIERQVMESLEKARVEKYTKLPRIHGKGSHSVPHFDTHVWPGFNNALLIATDEQTSGKVLEEMRKLKVTFEKEGIKVFVLPLEEML